jgi:hypothetical protein
VPGLSGPRPLSKCSQGGKKTLATTQISGTNFADQLPIDVSWLFLAVVTTSSTAIAAIVTAIKPGLDGNRRRSIQFSWSVALEQRASAREKFEMVRHQDGRSPQAHDPMSDTRDRRDLLAELARIDRDRAERHNLLVHETEKFRAEEAKLWRDWMLAAWAFAIGILSALIGDLILWHI